MSDDITRLPSPSRKILSLAFNKLSEAVNLWLYKCARTCPRSTPRSGPEKILITKLDSIGDFVLFTAALPTYRELFPESYIVMLVRDNVANLAETCPYVDEVWSLNAQKFKYNLLERCRWQKKVVRYGFDIAINAAYSNSFVYLDCLAAWSKAPRRMAFECRHDAGARTSPNAYYSELLPQDDKIDFEIHRNYAMLRYLGCSGTAQGVTRLWPTNDDRQRVAILREQFGRLPYAILFPGAGVARRRWPKEKFVSAVQQLSTRLSLFWAICGSGDESALCNEISKMLSASNIKNAVLAGTTSLRELAVLMEGALFYLGNETSGAHMAVAAGIPSICVLGGGHHGRFFPYHGNELTFAVTHQMPCFHCDWQCPYDEYECVARVKVEDVVLQVLAACQAQCGDV